MISTPRPSVVIHSLYETTGLLEINEIAAPCGDKTQSMTKIGPKQNWHASIQEIYKVEETHWLNMGTGQLLG